MGARPKWTLLRRRHTYDLQTHGKMLNITHYYRNENQNYNEVLLPYTVRMVIIKNPQIINAGEGVEKREPKCTVGCNVN